MKNLVVAENFKLSLSLDMVGREHHCANLGKKITSFRHSLKELHAKLELVFTRLVVPYLF